MFVLLLLLLAANPVHADAGHAKADEAYEEALARAAGLEHRANELVAASAAAVTTSSAAGTAGFDPWEEENSPRVSPAAPSGTPDMEGGLSQQQQQQQQQSSSVESETAVTHPQAGGAAAAAAAHALSLSPLNTR